MWPLRRKDSGPTTSAVATAPQARKSASFLIGMGAWRGLLNNVTFEKLAEEGYATNAVANACINRIAAAIASVDPQVYRRGKGGKLTKLDAHPLLDLMELPNPAQSYREFIRHLVSYYLTGGNAYILGNGLDAAQRKQKPPSELQLLNPGRIRIEPGNALFPKFYQYTGYPAGQSATYPVDQVDGRSAVLQLKTFNPLNPWYGLSPLMAAALSIDIWNGGQKWNKRLLDNDARPSGALIVKNEEGKPASLTEEQYDRLKSEIDDQFSGAHNAGRPMLLEGGLEWQQMSITSKDMDFLKGKDSSARDIGLVFGVPGQLLGITGDSTFSNYEQASLSFWTDTVIPLLSLIMDGFNRWLSPTFGDDIYLWYDEETIPALEPRRKEKFDRLKAADWLTFNEKRNSSGEDDIEGGDTAFINANLIPLDQAGLVDPKLHPELAGDTPQDTGKIADDAKPPKGTGKPKKG